MGLLLMGCKNDEIVREPSPATNPNSTNVYFSAKNVVSPILAKDATSLDVIIDRENGTQAQTVPLTVESLYADNVFQVPTSVSFAAGETTKTIKVPVDLELMKKYHITVTIDMDQTNPYKTQAVYPRLDLNVLKEDYVPYSEGTFTSAFFEQSWDQSMEFSPALTAYRFKDLYEVGYNYTFSVGKDGVIKQIPSTVVKSGYVDAKYGMTSVQAQAGSKFDDASSTYTFMLKFTVAAGSFGVNAETYVITRKL